MGSEMCIRDSMEAARRIDGELLSYTQAALAALEAGCDLALLCNQSVGEGAPLDELLDGVAAARAARRWRPNAASERRRLALLPRGEALTWPQLTQAESYLRARAMLQI